MLFITHAITGATIGLASGNPILGFILGFLSHHVLDAIPHFDQGSFYLSRDFRKPAWLGAEHHENGKKFKVMRDWAILLIDMASTSLLSLALLLGHPPSVWLLYIVGATGGLMPDILDASPFWKHRFRATKIGKLDRKSVV